MDPVLIFAGSVGQNDKNDHIRLSVDPATAEFSATSDVVIDNSGMVKTRAGSSLVVPATLHSLFRDKGDMFVAQDRTSDAAIMQVLPDLSLVGVRSGLHKGAKISWAQAGAATFYANGWQNGVIINGASNPWPAPEYARPADSKEFMGAPIGQHIAHKDGIMGVADGTTVWFNHLPFSYGLFHAVGGFVQFASRVLMLRPVTAGWFVSDEERTWFLRGNSPRNFVQELKAEYPAVEWSDASDYMAARDAGIEGGGSCAVWLGAEGVCIGLPDGSLLDDLTRDKITLPSARRGATLVYDRNKIISTIF